MKKVGASIKLCSQENKSICTYEFPFRAYVRPYKEINCDIYAFQRDE